MATLKRDKDGKLKVEEDVAASGGDSALVRAYSLSDARPNAYTSTVTLEGGARVYIFEHRASRIKEFQSQMKGIAAQGQAADALEGDEKEAATLATLDAMHGFYHQINACIRGWDFEGTVRAVDYEAEKEDLPLSVVTELGEQILTKHVMGRQESELSRGR